MLLLRLQAISPAKAVIHTVGPVWHGGDSHEAEILEQAYRNCLRLAADNGYKTMAFPAISTGVYGYPKEAAATIAVNTVYHYLSSNPCRKKSFLSASMSTPPTCISGF